MPSKISYFNKTFFFKNVKRFWPIWAGYFIILAVILPFSLAMSQMQAEHMANNDFGWIISRLLGMTISPVLLAVFSVLSAMSVFSYLFVSRNCNMIHSLPVKREELYITNYVSGLLFTVVPQTLIFTITHIILAVSGLPFHGALNKWFLISLLILFFFYSTTVMLCMFSGNMFWPPVLFLIFNLLYVGLRNVLLGLAGIFLFGFSGVVSTGSQDEMLSPLFYLIRQIKFSVNEKQEIITAGTDFLWIYGIAALVFVVIGLLLYKQRHLECAGDVIALKWMKPIFLWGASICSALTILVLFLSFYFYNYNSFDTKNFIFSIFLTLIISILCFFIVEMILKKKFRVFNRKKIREGGVFALIMVALLMCIRFDLFHVVNKVPAVAEIDGATLGFLCPIAETEPENIQYILDLHKKILKSKKDLSLSTEESTSLSIEYSLKNGKKLDRVYSIPTQSGNDSIKSLVNDLLTRSNDISQFKKLLGIEKIDDLIGLDSGVELLSSSNESYSASIQTIEPVKTVAILTAYLADIEEGNVVPYSLEYRSKEQNADTYYNSINLTFAGASANQEMIERAQSSSNPRNPQVYQNSPDSLTLILHITKNCSNTINALKQSGIDTDSFLTFEEYNVEYER